MMMIKATAGMTADLAFPVKKKYKIKREREMSIRKVSERERG